MAVLSASPRDSMTLPPHLLGMQTGDSIASGPDFGHRYSQSFNLKSSVNADSTGFPNGAFHSSKPSLGGYLDKQLQRNHVQPINTGRQMTANNYNATGTDMQTPQTGADMNFTPLLPSGLLMGSPFQPGSPSTFQSPQFQSFSNFPQQHV